MENVDIPECLDGELYRGAVRLWNVLVEVAKRNSLGENRDVRLRAVVCNLLRLVPKQELSQTDCDRRVTLFRFLTRTGKLWVEASPPNVVLAKECWESARETWEQLTSIYEQELDSELVKDLKSHLLNYYVVLSGFNFQQKEYENAFDNVTKALDECCVDEAQA